MPALFTSSVDRAERGLGGGVERVDRVGLRDVEEVDEGAAARGLDLRRHLRAAAPPAARRSRRASPAAPARRAVAAPMPGGGARHDRRRAARAAHASNRIGSAAKPRTLTEWTRCDARRLDLPAREPRSHLLERDAPLEARQRRAQAEVRALAEGEAALRVAEQVEAVGVGEGALVAVGRADQQHHLVAGAQLLAVQLDVARHQARERLGRVVVAQRLLDPARDQRRVRGAPARAAPGCATASRRRCPAASSWSRCPPRSSGTGSR